MTTAVQNCRECGAQIQVDRLGAFCGPCLLKLGLGKPGETSPIEERENVAGADAGALGSRIGRYRLLEEIGHGGCGVVYRAEQEEPVRREVALKLIKLGMDTRQVVARFEAERQTLALMDHPNIARVLDAGATDSGRPYFVMELVGGVRITDYCDQHQLGIRERLALFIQVCRGVQHAHQKGVIHRDLKPSNVLVTRSDGVPVPKVIDFGIAKATQGPLADQALFTAYEQLLGTPAYMSPEQAELGNVDVDTRSDIYSLGVLLYELLTGITPFNMVSVAAAGLDVMRRTIRETVPLRPSVRFGAMAEGDRASRARDRRSDAARLVRHLRGELDWIVMKCLEKDRARRYETANGLAKDVERYLHQEPILARPPSRLYEFQKTVRRHQFGFGATAVLIVVLALGVTVSMRLAIRATRAEAEQKRLHQESQDNLWAALLSEARALRMSGQPGRHFESLAALRKAAAMRPTLALRNEAIAGLILPDLREVARKDFSVSAQSVAMDPRFEAYAVCDREGDVSVRRLSDDTELSRLRGSEAAAVAIAGFSPDGRLLSVGYSDGCWQVWDWAAAVSVLQVDGLKSVSIAADGRTAAVSDASSVSFYSLASGERLWQISMAGVASERAPAAVALDPSGHRLAVFGTERGTNVTLLDTSTGRAIRELPHASWVWHVAWHPGATQLATGCADQTIHFWDTVAGSRLRSLRGESCIRLCFDPAGEILASSGWDGYTRLWAVASGRELCSVYQCGNLWGFAPDGQRLTFSSWDGKTLVVLETARTEGLRTLYENPQPAGGGPGEAVFDARGERVAFRTQEGVALWDVQTGQARGFGTLERTQTLIGFDAGSTNLLLTGTSGLIRIPLAESGDRSSLVMGGAVHVNPLCADPEWGRMGWVSADGRTCVVVGENRGQIFTTATGEMRVATDIQPGMRFGALNADGSLFASGAWHAGGVRVWDTHTGKLVRTLLGEEEAQDASTTVAFSPDNRLLVAAAPAGYLFWQIGSWSLAHSVPATDGNHLLGRMAISPDGRLFAASRGRNLIRLYRLPTGELLADLQTPGTGAITGLAFDPEGVQLFASESTDALRVWNLRIIRRQLAELGLDWEPPSTR